jgi:hypothetical protein
MEALTDEQGLKPVSGFNVYDMVLITHLIEKLLRGGNVTGKELSFVAGLRAKAILTANIATGLDIDQIIKTQGG